MKCDIEDLAESSTWSDIGDLLRKDADRLRRDLRLVERQIVVALPKLSATEIEALLRELHTADPTIARTVLNAALDAAAPVSAARRYLEQFHDVRDHLRSLDPEIARTFANATFMARSPRLTAMEHFIRFRQVMKKLQGDVPFARTVAKAACRAVDPAAAVERFIANYNHIVDDLVAAGVGPRLARSLASIASVGAEPFATARTLLERFERALTHVRTTHPVVARRIALSACRSVDPLAAADRYQELRRGCSSSSTNRSTARAHCCIPRLPLDEAPSIRQALPETVTAT